MSIINTTLANDYDIIVNKNTKDVIIGGKDYSNYTQYVKCVGAKGDFLYLKDAIDWFNANATNNYEFILDSTTHIVSDTITVNNASHRCIIHGLSSSQTLVIAGTGLANKPMFIIKSNCDFDRVGFVGTSLTNYGNNSTENCINLPSLNAMYIEIQNCVFSGFYNQIYDSIGTKLFIFNSILKNAVNDSININTTSSSAYLDCSVNTFENNTKSINLLKANTGGFNITANMFENASGQTSINYVGADYITSGICNISGNSFNLIGTFSAGFLFNGTETPTGRDKNIMINANQGIENKTPHAKINGLNNISTTTITNAGTFYKVNFNNSSSYTCKFTIANNRFTYQPLSPIDLKLWVSCNIAVNQNSRNVDVAIVKNGNPVLGLFGQMTCRSTSQNVYYPVSSNVYLDGANTGDYFELWVTSSSNQDVVTVNDICMLIESM